MRDLISRQAAIDALVKLTNCNGVRELYEYVQEHHLSDMWSGGIVDAIDAVIGVPSAQPALDEWCTDCKEYDQKKHCCPRWNRVIRETLKDAQPERKKGQWIDAVLPNDSGGLQVQVCDQCNTFFPLAYTGGGHNFCPNCGADMRGGE